MPFDLLSATPVSNTVLLLKFSTEPDVAFGDDISKYSVPGLTLKEVFTDIGGVGEYFVFILTGHMVDGVSYTMTISAPFLDVSTAAINVNTATFTGVSEAYTYTVSNLAATTGCDGKEITLTWDNPTNITPLYWIIRRRTRSFPFVISYATEDAADTLYESNVSISTFTDTTDLVGNMYYYYTVAVFPSPNPTYDALSITDDSRVMALSLDTLDSKNNFFWRTATKDSIQKDAVPAGEGGGGGALDDWYSVAGCWLNMMRGNMKAIQLLNDADQSPMHAVKEQVRALGTEPEGDSYDLATPRRMLLQLPEVHKKRGTCPGIVLASSMLTLWDVLCAEVGIGSTCGGGASTVTTWDGTYRSMYATASFSSVNSEGKVTYNIGSKTDPTLNTTVYPYVGGKIMSNVGDVVCIESASGANQLVSRAPTFLNVTILTPLPYAVNSTTLSISDTTGLQPGMSIQLLGITSPGGFLYGEVIDIGTVTPPNTITFATPTSFGYSTLQLSIDKSFFRYKIRDTRAALIGATTYTVPDSRWVVDQWKGGTFAVVSPNQTCTITSNTADTVTFTPALAANHPSPQEKSIYAPYFSGTRYAKITTGPVSTVWNDRLDIELRGTRYDNSSRLWSGSAAPLMGSWGPKDLITYVLSSVAITYGIPAGLVGTSTLQVDPSAITLIANNLVGCYLNPNQNQSTLFEIISNTTNTITVAEDLTGFIQPWQYYYVLSARDKARFTALTLRLNHEFTHSDVDTHVLFV